MNKQNTPPQHPDAQANSITRTELNRIRKTLLQHVRGKPIPPISSYGALQMAGLLLSRSLKVFVLILAILVFLIGGVGTGILYGYFASTEPIPTELLKSGSETSYIYDAEGNILAKQTGALNIDRRYVDYEKVQNTYIADAFISIEDERFETHIGIDPKRIASAIISAIANGGTATHGGSTIVQQTVKLITGNDQRSAQRKVQEWYRAIMLDEQLSKQEIMELYLNLVPMGNSYIGIEAAAEGYFDKHAGELTLAECAFLAGIPKGPAIYNPRTERGMRNTLRRQRVVLSKMYQLGKITREEYDKALRTEIMLRQTPEKWTGTSINSYFVEYVLQEVVDNLVEKGYNRNVAYQYVSSGGLHIHTTLEPKVQNALDKAFSTQELFQAKPSYYEDFPEKPEAAMVVINNETGAIAGLQGGYGEKQSNLIFNRATSLARQPGSSIKPLVAYGPALDVGKFVGSSIIQDKEVFFNGPGKAWPTNFDLKYHGPVTFRNALKASLNVPAVTILKEIGVETGKRYLKNMDIDWTKDDVGLAAAVGAPQHGVSPLQMAQAYATFANQGVYRRAYSFTKVIDSNGNVILDNENRKQSRVFKQETAYIMNTMLIENLKKRTSAFGLFSDAAKYGPVVNGANVAITSGGKTGTTDNNVDKWFVGFTPYYTAATWYGFDNNIKQTSIPEQDWENPIRIWRNVMDHIHLNLKPKNFEKPNDIIEKRISITDGQLANADTPGDYVMSEWYPQNSPLIPTQESTNGKTAEELEKERLEEESNSFSDWLEGIFGSGDNNKEPSDEEP